VHIRKLHYRIAASLVTLCVVSLVGVCAYDRDAVKAAPLVGQLPWHVVLGNTAIQAEDRPIESFLGEAEKAGEAQPELLFLGDSLSRYWRKEGRKAWDQHFASYNALSLGVGGDRTQHLLFRLRSGVLDPLRPKQIVLQIGTNNVNRNTPEEISEAIETIVAELGTKWPQARLIVLAIPPREMPRSQHTLDRVKATNELLLRRLEDRSNVAFLNVSDEFLAADGWINPSLYSPEGIHLSERGYSLLADKLTALLGH
jgi:lysophospholipase L1-like esterase